jgi:hypothetical protein
MASECCSAFAALLHAYLPSILPVPSSERSASHGPGDLYAEIRQKSMSVSELSALPGVS